MTTTAIRSLGLLSILVLTLPVDAQELRAQWSGHSFGPAIVKPVYAPQDGFLKDYRFFVYGGWRFSEQEMGGGIGIERSWRIDSRLSVLTGFGLDFQKGRKPQGSFFVGFSIKE